MDDDLDFEKFRTLLLKQKQELQEIEATGNAATETVELDQTRLGRLSRMDALQGQAMSRETKRRREIRLRKINTALQRIKEGEYGFCHSCEEPISTGRLEVDPTAVLCIGCAE